VAFVIPAFRACPPVFRRVVLVTLGALTQRPSGQATDSSSRPAFSRLTIWPLKSASNSSSMALEGRCSVTCGRDVTCGCVGSATYLFWVSAGFRFGPLAHHSLTYLPFPCIFRWAALRSSHWSNNSLPYSFSSLRFCSNVSFWNNCKIASRCKRNASDTYSSCHSILS
jgi:hypothetical protein